MAVELGRTFRGFEVRQGRMKSITLSPKLVAAILILAVMVVGGIFYKGMSGPSVDETEQRIEEMHKKMLKLPSQQPTQSQPVPQPTKP